MDRNRLRLNQDKTQVIWIGTSQQLAKVSASKLTLPSAVDRFSTTVFDFGYIVDPQLNMSDHVVHDCMPILLVSNAAAATGTLFTDVRFKTLVHAFISSRLDHTARVF